LLGLHQDLNHQDCFKLLKITSRLLQIIKNLM